MREYRLDTDYTRRIERSNRLAAPSLPGMAISGGLGFNIKTIGFLPHGSRAVMLMDRRSTTMRVTARRAGPRVVR